MYGSGYVGVQLLLPRAEDSPGREDRITVRVERIIFHGTKVLHVASDDLHVIGIESELGKRSLGRLL